MPAATPVIPVRILEKYMTKPMISPTVRVPAIARATAKLYISRLDSNVIA